MSEIVAVIEDTLEHVADIDGKKDCIMSQQEGYWFNIDIPKGSGLSSGSRVRITVEKID